MAASSTRFSGRWPEARCKPPGGDADAPEPPFWPASLSRPPARIKSAAPEGSGGGASSSCHGCRWSAFLPPPPSRGLRHRPARHRGPQHLSQNDGGLQILLPSRSHEADEGRRGRAPATGPGAAQVNRTLHRTAAIADLSPGDVLQITPGLVHRVRTPTERRDRPRRRRWRLGKAPRGSSGDRPPFAACPPPFLIRIQSFHPAGRTPRRRCAFVRSSLRFPGA